MRIVCALLIDLTFDGDVLNRTESTRYVAGYINHQWITVRSVISLNLVL